ncbi:MAG: DUF4239 domain-containing protein [Verrucomicrobiota bacterium]
MTALLSLPMWLVGLIFIVGGAVIAVVAVFALNPLVKRAHSEEHNTVFSNSFAAVATLFAIVAGLLVFAVVGAYDSASSSASNEAATLRQMYQNAQVFPGPQKVQAEDAITEYTKSVVADEYPLLADGKGSPKTGDALNNMFRVIGTMTPAPSWSDQYSEVSSKMTDVVALRAARINASQPALSPVYLFLLFFSAGVTVVCMSFLYMENRAMKCVAVSLMAMSLAAVLFLMVEVNSPFSGEISVSTDVYTQALEAMAQIGR